MKSISMVVALALTVLASAAFGYVYGGSNLSPLGYPEFNKMKPMRPFNADNYSAQYYKSQVDSYLNDVDRYIENAVNDGQRIIQSVENAKRDAKNVVDEYNRFVRSRY